MEDYFEDYFFRKITLRSKIVAESKITLKIVSKWEITLKITLRANNPQNSRGRCVHLWLGLVLEKVIGSDISTTVHANDKISTSFSGQ